MTVERTYKCNLCHDSHQPESLIGIFWTADRNRPIDERPAREVEHHVCVDCATAIRLIMESRRK